MLHKKGDLTENKLILLYLLQQAGLPLQLDLITVLVTEQDWMYYFDMCQHPLDLSESGLIATRVLGGESFYIITPEGRESLTHFQSRIPFSIREKIDAYVRENHAELAAPTHIHATFHQREDGDFLIRLSLTEEDTHEIFSMALMARDRREAAQICQEFRKRGPSLYAQVVHQLTSGVD